MDENKKTYKIRELSTDLLDKEILVIGKLKKRFSKKYLKSSEGSFEDFFDLDITETFGIDILKIRVIKDVSKELISKIDYELVEPPEIIVKGILSGVENKNSYEYILLNSKIIEFVNKESLDIDKISTGLDSRLRIVYKKLEKILDKLELEVPEITFDNLKNEAIKDNISEEEVKKTLDKFKQEGIIFEPRKKVYKKLI